MRILPVAIILFCSALILKGGALVEKSLLQTKNYNSLKNIDKEAVNSDIEYMSEETTLSNSENIDANPGKKEGEKATSPDKKDPPKKDSYPSEDFVKECISQPTKYNDIEVQMLENLSNRRKELDQREANIFEKEKLIQIAAAQAEEKLTQLKTLETSLQNLLAQYNEKEDSKIQSLVRIYQAMKPTDAAKIFDELDMEILLQVINKMKESNAASIIASMSPEKAKELTIRIAKQKQLVEKR